MLIFILLITSFSLLSACTSEPLLDEQWLEDHYTKSEVMIPMRDSISLYTSIYAPLDKDDSPVLLVRTPYSCAPYGEGWKSDLLDYMTEFLVNEYVIVFQDVRGRYMSEGEYVNVRPYLPDKTELQTDEASDTYDTIEWIINNVESNGAVGVSGMSYPGFYATMAALSGHPALKAVSPQAPILDWYKGDDVHHNGALMLLDIYSFAPYMFKNHNNPTESDHGLPSPIGEDAYSWFLNEFTIPQLTSALPDTLMFWNEILEHPDYDQYWQDRSLEHHLNAIYPAILVVGGSFDTDDCYGAINTYRLIRENSPETDLHLVYGPWTHGGWHEVDYQGLGDMKFGKDISRYFMQEVEFPFFQYYLQGEGTRPKPVYVHSSGSDIWQIMEEWPSQNLIEKSLYLRDGNALSFDMPDESSSSSLYVSDPTDPVPFMEDATRRNKAYMVADQSFASKRSDVLTFVSDELDTTLKLEGPLSAELFLTLSTTDADIVVKFIDVHPDGYQMLVRGEVFPVRYRNGYDTPTPVVPHQMIKVEFTMNDIAHWILPEHRLMVQIQSSWYPLVNMNPQTFMENIYTAEREDYVKTEVNIFHQQDSPSRILLPVAE